MAEVEVAQSGSRNARGWCVTVWQFDTANPAACWTELPDRCVYMVWGHELTDEGRPHLHVYLHYNQAVSMGKVKNDVRDNTAHCEKRRGSVESAVDYAKKETVDDHPVFTNGRKWWELGNIGKTGQGSRSDVQELVDGLRAGKSNTELIEALPYAMFNNSAKVNRFREMMETPKARFPIKVFLIEGPTGIGKTRHVFEHVPDVYSVPEPVGGRLWFSGYQGQDTILIDDFGTEETWIKAVSPTTLFKILDPYPLTVEVKGGYRAACWTTVIITTNIPFEYWWKSINQPHLEALKRRLTSQHATIIKASTSEELEEKLRASSEPNPSDPITIDE